MSVNEHETHAAVVAETHKIAERFHEDYLSDPVAFKGYERIANEVSTLASRFEAAHKRELSKIVSKNGADFGQLGDAAKSLKTVDLRFDICRNIALVLKIGRDYQNKDGYRGAHYDTVKLLCDAIEYQQEQLETNTEVGDAAKLRKAVKKVLDAVKHLSRTHNDCLPEDVRAVLGDIAFDANAALAAPPRNCDRFGGDIDKLREACLRERGLNPDEDFPEVFCEWLLAKAKGENDVK